MKKTVLLVIAFVAILTAAVVSAVYVTGDEYQSELEAAANNVVTEQIEETDVVVAEPEQTEEVEEVESEPESEYIEYVVEAGDSLWAIADKFYDDGNLYTKVASDNEMGVTDVIHPGDVLKIFSAEYDTASISEVEYAAAPVEDTSVEVINTSSYDGDMSVEEAIAILRDVPSTDTSGMEYLGTYRITGYDPHCAHCCGKTDGITASGRQAEFGVTVGCNSLPLGTEVYIEGYGFYRIDDTGGMSMNVIDIAAPSHDVCYTLTNNSVNVWIVS